MSFKPTNMFTRSKKNRGSVAFALPYVGGKPEVMSMSTVTRSSRAEMMTQLLKDDTIKTRLEPDEVRFCVREFEKLRNEGQTVSTRQVGRRFQLDTFETKVLFGDVYFVSVKDFVLGMSKIKTLLRAKRGGFKDAVFKLFDSDNNGDITFSEYNEVMRVLRDKYNTDDVLRRKSLVEIMKSTDRDRSEEISIEEFVSSGGKASHFKKIDVDGSGGISSKEYEDYILDSRLRRNFRKLDRNRDGTIDRGETRKMKLSRKLKNGVLETVTKIDLKTFGRDNNSRLPSL